MAQVSARRRRAATAPRKAPTQDRARHTVDAILQAAGQVLARDGFDKASTNKIADAAGVSIGSLYQYFPGKEAVLKALVERHEARMLAVMRAHLEDVVGTDIPVLVRRLIEALLEAHSVDPRLQRVLLEHGGAAGASSIDDAVERLVLGALASRQGDLRPLDRDVAAFVLVTAVRTVCHRAVVERQDSLSRATFVDELTRLVLGYVALERRQAAKASARTGVRTARRGP